MPLTRDSTSGTVTIWWTSTSTSKQAWLSRRRRRNREGLEVRVAKPVAEPIRFPPVTLVLADWALKSASAVARGALEIARRAGKRRG